MDRRTHSFIKLIYHILNAYYECFFRVSQHLQHSRKFFQAAHRTCFQLQKPFLLIWMAFQCRYWVLFFMLSSGLESRLAKGAYKRLTDSYSRENNALEINSDIVGILQLRNANFVYHVYLRLKAADRKSMKIMGKNFRYSMYQEMSKIFVGNFIC